VEGRTGPRAAGGTINSVVTEGVLVIASRRLYKSIKLVCELLFLIRATMWSCWRENMVENSFRSSLIHSLPMSILFPATREFSKDGEPQGYTRRPCKEFLFERPEAIAPPFKLLSSNTCEIAFKILIQLSKPPSFGAADITDLLPSKSDMLVYQLHFLPRPFETREDKIALGTALEQLLGMQFESLLPLARYLLSLLLDRASGNDELLFSVLLPICRESTTRLFRRTARNF
jgi:hypothetical protein